MIQGGTIEGLFNDVIIGDIVHGNIIKDYDGI